MGKPRFQQRFIAFVDILGFSDIVQRMSREPDLFATVRDVLKDLDGQSLLFQEYRRKRRHQRNAALRKGRVPLVRDTNLQMTAFSDCYVISEVAPAWHVLAAVQGLGSRLLAEGILTRGAVVKGKAYHNRRVLFGPGIIDAYHVEREVAKYPRIILSEVVRDAVWGYHEGLWQGHLLKRDVDGCWYVNLLTPSLSSWSPLGNPSTPEDVRSHLKKMYHSLNQAWKRAQGNAAYMSKLWWLIHQFNKAAKKEKVREITY